MKFSELEYSTQVILKVILAALILLFLWVVRDIIIILILALILASAMEPMVEYFNRKKIPRGVSVLAVYILVFGITALVFYLLLPPVAQQFKIMAMHFPDYAQRLQDRLGGLFGPANISNFIHQIVGSFDASHTVVSGTFGVFNGLFSIITVLVISFYLVAQKNGMKTFIDALIPAHNHDFALGLVQKIQRKMGFWILGQIILSLSIFVLSFIGLTLLHVPYALALALVAGLLEVVPYLGPILSAIPAVIIALLQSPALAIAVALLYLLIQKTEGYILVPKVMQKTVGTSPLVVVVALLVGFKLAGIVGLLVAVPLVVAITVAIHEFWPSKTG